MLYRFLLVSILFYSCSNKKISSDKDISFNMGKIKRAKKSRKNNNLFSEKIDFDTKKLINPITGKIPTNIRKLEVMFSSNIPLSISRNTPSGEKIYSSNWQLEGPKNVGGRTRSFGIDINNPNKIIAGGVSGGLFISKNKGKSWERIDDGITLFSVTSIAQDKRENKSHIWYYGTGEYFYLSPIPSVGTSQIEGNGIYKSVDSGKTWKIIETTTTEKNGKTNPFRAIKKIEVNPYNGFIYVATLYGVFLSPDEGNSWVKILGKENSTALYDFIILKDSSIYITEGASLDLKNKKSRIFYSKDSHSWSMLYNTYETNIANRNPFFDLTKIRFSFYNSLIAADKDKQEKIYFFLDPSIAPLNIKKTPYLFVHDRKNKTSDSIKRLYVPGTNGYKNWGEEPSRFFDTQLGYNFSIATHPTDTNLIYIGGIDLYRSTDGFTTDKNFAHIGGYNVGTSNYSKIYPNHHPDIHSIEVTQEGEEDIVTTGSDGGIHQYIEKKQNSVDWISLNNSYITTQFYDISIVPNSEKKYIMGGMQDNGIYFKNDSTGWKSVIKGDGGKSFFTSKGLDKFYFSVQRGRLYKSYKEKNENKIIECYKTDTYNQANFDFISPMELNPNNEDMVFIAKKNDLMINKDASSNFKCINNWKTLVSIEGGSKITVIRMVEGIKDKIYLGTSKGEVYIIDINKNGDVLNQNKYVVQDSKINYYISDISVNKNNGNEILVVFSNYGIKSVFISKNEGKTWEDISYNLEEFPDGSGSGPSIYSSKIVPITKNSSMYFVGTSTGLYSMMPEDFKWYKEGKNLVANSIVTDIEYRENDSWLVVSTYGNGVYSSNIELPKETRKYSQMGKYDFGILNSTNLQDGYSRIMKYAFVLKSTSKIRIKIYDFKGTLLATPLDDIVKNGNYYLKPFEYDLSEFAQGIYILIFEVNGVTSDTKKIIIE